MKLTPKQIFDKVEKLKGDRITFEDHWQELADYIQPNKNDINRYTVPGDKRNTHLYDSSAIQANNLLASALHGMLTSPTNPWFGLTSGEEKIDKMDNVRFWLQKVEKTIFNILNNSNFQTEMHEVYLDLGCFGTAALAIEEDEELFVRFSAKHIREVFVQEDARGNIDEVYRSYKYTAQQIVNEYGIENVSKKVKNSFEKGMADKYDVIHAIYKEYGKENAIWEYHSQHVLVDDLKELRYGFFKEMPIVVPRWTKTTGEIYGRSPGMNALPDIKMINEVMKTTIRGAQKTVDPPLMLPDDGFVLPIITKPGGLNYYRAGSADRIETFANDAKIDFGYQVMDDMRARIRDAFFIDQLQLQQGPQMTATEVNQRTEEKMRLLGPMLGRQQSELLRPLVNRVFEILIRRNVIKKSEIPQELSGRKLDVHYTSFIAKVQKTQDANNLLRAVQLAAPFIQSDPASMDIINADEAVKYVLGVYGVAQEVQRTKEEIKAVRQGRAEQQQAQQQQVNQGINIDQAKGISEIVSQQKLK